MSWHAFCRDALAVAALSFWSDNPRTDGGDARDPDWALPSGPNHKQYPPPDDFHRPTKTFDTPIGIFQGQSDVGGPLVPGNASYDAKARQYTVTSAGYNIWYTRDEFRYLWKKMSGDVSFAADVSFAVPQDPPHDRKVVLVSGRISLTIRGDHDR